MESGKARAAGLYLAMEGVCAFHFRGAGAGAPSLERHTHAQALELLLVTRGVQVFESDGMDHRLYGKDLLINPPGTPHTTASEARHQGECYCLALDMRPEESLLGLNVKQSQALRARLAQVAGQVYHGTQALCDDIAAAYEHARAGTDQALAYAQAELVLFVHRLLEVIEQATQGDKDRAIEAVCDYINRHISQPLTLEELAQRADYSLSYFKAKFKDEMGIPPTQYVNLRKIERAKRMLAQGMSVTDTAMGLSFGSSNYFATVFRKLTGYTPSDYQRMIDEESANPVTHATLRDR